MWNGIKRGGLLFAEQREATVLVVDLLLVIYFWRASPDFLTADNIANITWIVTPIAIIAIGEVLLLVLRPMVLPSGCARQVVSERVRAGGRGRV